MTAFPLRFSVTKSVNWKYLKLEVSDRTDTLEMFYLSAGIDLIREKKEI